MKSLYAKAVAYLEAKGRRAVAGLSSPQKQALYEKARSYLIAHGVSVGTINRLGAVGTIGLYLALIVGGALLMVGWFVIATLQNSFTTKGWTAAQNTTNTSLNNYIGTAFLLGGIGMIALGAGGVIYSLTSSFGFGGRQ